MRIEVTRIEADLQGGLKFVVEIDFSSRDIINHKAFKEPHLRGQILQNAAINSVNAKLKRAAKELIDEGKIFKIAPRRVIVED